MNPEKNLRKLRSMYNLSQDDVAQALGISQTSIVATEKGERDFSSEELLKLADFLGLEMTELIAPDQPDYDKYREMIVETLRRYTAHSSKSAAKTLLAKLLYLVDFAWYYEHLQPMSGMKYRRLQYGPAPEQYFRCIDELVYSGRLSLFVTGSIQWLKAKHSSEDAPPQYLSAAEIDLIQKATKKWKNADTKEIVHFTHAQIPWQVCRQDEFIPYEPYYAGRAGTCLLTITG